jgi:hypothetical protein
MIIRITSFCNVNYTTKEENNEEGKKYKHKAETEELKKKDK